MEENMHEKFEEEEVVTRRECYLLRSAMENRLGGFESQMVELRTEIRNVKDALNGFRTDLGKMREDRIKFESEVKGEFTKLNGTIGMFEVTLYKKVTWILVLLLVAFGGIILGRVIDIGALGALIP